MTRGRLPARSCFDEPSVPTFVTRGVRLNIRFGLVQVNRQWTERATLSAIVSGQSSQRPIGAEVGVAESLNVVAEAVGQGE
jgi:hypothetical protein